MVASGAHGLEQMNNYTSNNGEDEAHAATTWVGCQNMIGSSLEEGKAPAANFFNVRATGLTITGSSSSVQVQGLRFPAAGCNRDL